MPFDMMIHGCMLEALVAVKDHHYSSLRTLLYIVLSILGLMVPPSRTDALSGTLVGEVGTSPQGYPQGYPQLVNIQ